MNEHKLSKLTLLLMVELLELIHRPKIATHWWTHACRLRRWALHWPDLHLVLELSGLRSLLMGPKLAGRWPLTTSACL